VDQQPSPTRSPARVDPRPNVAIVGAGRAGSALAVALQSSGYRVVAVSSRTPAAAMALSAAVHAGAPTTPAAAARRAELTFLTVPDSALHEVVARIAASPGAGSLPGRVLVHCAAALDREVLSAARGEGAAVAALHPLQALHGAASAASLRGAGFALDADPEAADRLELLVSDLGGILLPVAAGQRAAYHAAAVLAGNAPLALLARAVQLLSGTGIDADLAGRALAGLLAGATANAMRMGAAAALTGPVVRDDAGTVASHLAALQAQPELQHLYTVLAIETLQLAGVDTHPEVAALLAGRPARADLPRVTAA